MYQRWTLCRRHLTGKAHSKEEDLLRQRATPQLSNSVSLTTMEMLQSVSTW